MSKDTPIQLLYIVLTLTNEPTVHMLTFISNRCVLLLHHLCDGGTIDEKAFSALKSQPDGSTGLYTEARWEEFTFHSNPSLNTCMAKTTNSRVSFLLKHQVSLNSHFPHYPVSLDFSIYLTMYENVHCDT